MVLEMILGFSLFLLILLFINFRINSNKFYVLPVIKIFIELKSISFFFIKLMVAFVLFLFLNYNRYIYYRVGLTINYGYVFIYAICLVLLL